MSNIKEVFRKNDMIIFTKMKDLVSYTLTITDGKKFPKRVRFTLVNRMQNHILSANELYLKANRYFNEDRRRLIVEADIEIDQLLTLMEISYNKKYISDSQCKYWVGLCVEVKRISKGWINSTRNK